MDEAGTMKRRLAAILAADVAGYSRLMEEAEDATVRDLKGHQAVILPLIGHHGGRIVDTAGDGILAEFPSVVGAVECAIEIQTTMATRNAGVPDHRCMLFRIGINLGDVIHDETRVYGDGINIAARLEALAEPGGVLLSHTVYEHVRDKLPFTFDDLGEHHVKNIARPLRVYRVRGPGAVSEKPPLPSALPLPAKPSIAVLPFQNMSGDPEQDYFADGMVEEIITALSRIPWLFVIARNSSFTYKGQAIDVKRVGRELGVHYVLEGSVRKAAGRVRIAAQLIDATGGAHLWADRFDGSLEDVFDLQDQVAISVAGVIEPTLETHEIRRSGRRPTQDLTAYDFYLRALPEFFAFPARERILAALRPLEEAIGRDPQYGPALALAAIGHARLFDWRDDPDTNRRKGGERARQAVAAAGDDPTVLAYAAFALAFLGEDIGTQIDLVDRALVLNPSFARAWMLRGALSVWAGQPTLAIEQAERSLRLDPRNRAGNHFWVMGIAAFFLRRFDESAAKLRLAIQQTPAWPWPYRGLAACYTHMERLDEARAVIDQLRALTSEVLPNDPPFRNPEHRELFLAGLRLAAGERTA
jgi:TolB-like protein/class 3 adenylate cyclase